MEFKNDSELFNYLENNAYAAAFSDILDDMGYRYQVISPLLGIRPLKENFVSMGRAVTLLSANDSDVDEPYEKAIECIDSLEPDSILVTAVTVESETGIMGELTATALRVRNCRGAIVDGYSRDAKKIIEMGFPTYAKGISPVDTAGRTRIVDFNLPIVIGGVRIFPDDIVFADLDGIVIIPKQIEKKVTNEVIERINTENTVRKELDEGKSMSEVWKRYHVL